MASDEPHEPKRRRVDRERVVRTLTFWLRPEFLLRVVNRFQKVAGFDRSIALASGALTAMIPLAIVTSALSSQLGGKGTADRIIDRYDLTGGGAEAVRDIFSPPSGTSTSHRRHRVPLPHGRGAELLPRRAAAVRADLGAQAAERPQHVQRAALDRRALAVRRRSAASLHAVLGRSRLELTATLLVTPLSAVFLVWTRLGAQRQADRAPGRSCRSPSSGSALLALYSVGAAVYVPHLFSTYATRYGVIGAVFAMISALFCVMVVIVGSAAAGREVHDELDRIRRGERPAEDEVRRQWDEVTAQARSRWETLREQIQERRSRRKKTTRRNRS